MMVGVLLWWGWGLGYFVCLLQMPELNKGGFYGDWQDTTMNSFSIQSIKMQYRHA